MCMYINNYQTEQLRQKMLAGKTIFYKVYEVVFGEQNAIRSKCMKTPVDVKEDGSIHSNRNQMALTEKEIALKAIDNGIHVFIELGIATNDKYPRDILVEVTASVDDLLGCDDSGLYAVFNKVKTDGDLLKRQIADFKKRCNDCGEVDCDGDCEIEEDDDEDDFEDDEDFDDDYEDEDEDEDEDEEEDDDYDFADDDEDDDDYDDDEDEEDCDE
jgi:DNA-directed RNA polymerase subunit delta